MIKELAATKVSVVIPTYGIEPALSDTIKAIVDDYPPYARNQLEVLIVHTPRDDSSLHIAELERDFTPYVRIVTEDRRGYGVAYVTGFKEARGDIIVTMDGDLTYPIEIIASLSESFITHSLDFLNTNRLVNHEPGSFHWSHGFGNKFLTLLMNMLFYTGFQDSQSGMWIIRKSKLKDIEVYGLHWEFSAEIKIEARLKNLRCAEVPIHYRRRGRGKSTNGVKQGIKIALFMLAKKMSLAKYFPTALS